MSSIYRTAHIRHLAAHHPGVNHEEKAEPAWFPLTIVHPTPTGVTFDSISYVSLKDAEFPERYPINDALIYAVDVQRDRWRRYRELVELSPPLTEEEKSPDSLRRLLSNWSRLPEGSRERLLLCTQFHLDDTVMHPYAENRDVAIERLQTMKVGSYLVRPSSVGDAVSADQVLFARVRVVSFRSFVNEVQHILIAHILGLGWVHFSGDLVELRELGFPKLGDKRCVKLLSVFPSAVELIAYMATAHNFDLSAFVCS